MPNIKPISDLRNYASLLETVQVGKPLYLTKNGRRQKRIECSQMHRKGGKKQL